MLNTVTLEVLKTEAKGEKEWYSQFSFPRVGRMPSTCA